MRKLSASELLTVWERGVGQNSVEQALLALAASSGKPREELSALPVGERDALLFAMYEQLFGPDLDAFAECPRCGERLEYSLTTRHLAQTAPATQEMELVCVGRVLQLRLPDSTDLTAIQECANEEEARRMLAGRCAGENAAALSDGDVDAIAERLAQADPRAEVLVDLQCPTCRSGIEVLLAIEQFLWAKIAWLAKRLLREVHVLARAYGWSEREILSLSAVRRRRYLELAEA